MSRRWRGKRGETVLPSALEAGAEDYVDYNEFLDREENVMDVAFDWDLEQFCNRRVSSSNPEIAIRTALIKDAFLSLFGKNHRLKREALRWIEEASPYCDKDYTFSFTSCCHAASLQVLELQKIARLYANGQRKPYKKLTTRSG